MNFNNSKPNLYRFSKFIIYKTRESTANEYSGGYPMHEVHTINFDFIIVVIMTMFIKYIHFWVKIISIGFGVISIGFGVISICFTILSTGLVYCPFSDNFMKLIYITQDMNIKILSKVKYLILFLIIY